jgi:hypothetical protein
MENDIRLKISYPAKLSLNMKLKILSYIQCLKNSSFKKILEDVPHQNKGKKQEWGNMRTRFRGSISEERKKELLTQK